MRNPALQIFIGNAGLGLNINRFFFGFEWLSPMGKIDVDFGFPVMKEDYDKTEVFRLNFGTSL